MYSKVLFNIVVLALFLAVSLACNGFKAKIIKVENCAGDDAVITLDTNFTVKLNKKCEIVPDGCVVNKPFTTATSSYKVTKDDMLVKEGKMDLCTMAEQAPGEVKDYLKIFGAPSSCPVKESKTCANDHVVDLSKYKALLSVARGKIVVDSKIEHDTGKSCFHVEMEISK